MSLKVVLFAFIIYGVSGQTAVGNENVVPLIVGGTTATAGEFRGKISIQYENGTHICGGTLIDERHVLTSATCVTNEWGTVLHPRTYRLMGDDLTISVESGNQNRQLRGASHIFVHPEFNLNSYDHNVAVIRVNESYRSSQTFNPVSRPDDSPSVNTQCSVAGWGSISNNGPISFSLMRINSVVISRAICNSNTSYNGTVRGGMFCAGNMAGGQGTCQRDDGGGLICNNLVTGIVSGNEGCAAPNFPTIYTDVAVYNSWIDSTLVWDEGEHEVVPTPTSMTTTTPVPTTVPTTTPSTGGAAVIVNSIYLLSVCVVIGHFK